MVRGPLNVNFKEITARMTSPNLITEVEVSIGSYSGWFDAEIPRAVVWAHGALHHQ